MKLINPLNGLINNICGCLWVVFFCWMSQVSNQEPVSAQLSMRCVYVREFLLFSLNNYTKQIKATDRWKEVWEENK